MTIQELMMTYDRPFDITLCGPALLILDGGPSFSGEAIFDYFLVQNVAFGSGSFRCDNAAALDGRTATLEANGIRIPVAVSRPGDECVFIQSHSRDIVSSSA